MSGRTGEGFQPEIGERSVGARAAVTIVTDVRYLARPESRAQGVGVACGRGHQSAHASENMATALLEGEEGELHAGAAVEIAVRVVGADGQIQPAGQKLLDPERLAGVIIGAEVPVPELQPAHGQGLRGSGGSGHLTGARMAPEA